MKVNNRKCISKMAGRLLMANKRRNLITIFAIILTAVLFTSLFTIMMSINASYETSMFRELGGYAHGTFKDVTPAQEEKLIAHRNIKAYGERMILGLIADDSFKNRSAEISFMDENLAKWSFIELKEGHLPVEKKDVVMDTEALRLLGVEPALGKQIELTFTGIDDSEEQSEYTDTFTLVGYWEFDPISPAHYINVSREYALDFAQMTDAPIRADLDVMLSSTFNAEGKMEAAILDSGYTGIRFGVNPGYTAIGMDGGEMLETALPLGAFLLLVIFTGYLIIYNVFQISVVNDIRFYGLLKTIGTTDKQIRRIIRLQALALCLVGIPAGLLLGYLLGSVLTPAVLGSTTISLNSLSVSSSPLIFVAAAFFEIITVLLSVSKPGRMAGKVSPIEALRFNDGMTGRKKKKATKGARVAQMALANTERNKKKTILVFTSLALSLVILNAVNMFVGGFDSEKWLNSTLSVDFVVGKYPYFKFQGARQGAITEEEISVIKENTTASNGGVAYVNANIPFVEGLDDFLMDKLDVCEGDASLLKDRNNRYIALLTHRFEDGSYVIPENFPEIGEKIKITDFMDIDTEPVEYEYTVCAFVEVPNDIGLRYSSTNYDGVVWSERLKEDFKDNVVPLFYAFDTDTSDAEEKAESFLHEYSEQNSNISYESKAVVRTEFEGFKNLFTVLGSVLCVIIGFVGMLNFFNTVMAGIIARKNEIAVLQAIGMTGKQVMQMLMIEGMIYTVGSGLIALLLSLLFVPIVNGAANSFFWFYSSHFSVTPVILMMPVMVLLGVLVPLLSYKGLSKASIVERIREIG